MIVFYFYVPFVFFGILYNFLLCFLYIFTIIRLWVAAMAGCRAVLPGCM